MAQRRAHIKSRRGCQQCKTSHVKCDEKLAGCDRCTRLGLTCSLLTPNSGLIIISDSPTTKQRKKQRRKDENAPGPPIDPLIEAMLTPISLASTPKPQELQEDWGAQEARETFETLETAETQQNTNPVRAPVHLGADNGDSDTTQSKPTINDTERHRLRLITHWTQSTSKTVANLCLPTDVGLDIWQEKVTTLALEHDFLLHGILGASALHMVLSNPSLQQEENLALAIRHHDLGLTLFRRQLGNITQDNKDALFAFSMLIALHSLGVHLTALSEHNPLAKIHELHTFIRGIGAVANSGGDFLGDGVFKPILLPDWLKTIPEKLPPLRPDIEGVLARLSSRIDTSITTSIHSKMYASAIDALHRTLYLATVVPYTQMTVILFPTLVDAEYLQMMCIGEPLALAILANYAVVYHWMREHVWLQTWGKEIIDAVQQTLIGEWRDCIEWAISEAATA